MNTPGIVINGFQITWPAILLGLIVGATYGILAVGLVLIYRINRIINFAHGQIGAFGAAMMSITLSHLPIPYWVFFPVALLISAGVGSLVEVGVVRRLRTAPRLMSVIATLGFAQFLTLIALLISSQSQTGTLFPEPPGFPSFRIGATTKTLGLIVLPSQVAMLALTPVVAIGLALFLRYTRYGMAMRASAANPESARLDGVSSSRMSTLAWAIAGSIAAFTAILVLPTVAGGENFGPGLVVRALAAAALARMSNLVGALVAGLGVGVVEQVIKWNIPSGGQTEAVLFVIILGALLFLQPRGGRVEEKGSVWGTVRGLRPLPEAYRSVWLIRNGSRILALIGILIGGLIPVILGAGQTATFTFIIAYTIVGLSLGVLTGLSGQVSLGQFAVAGIGAVVAIDTAKFFNNYLLAVLFGAVAGAAVSVLVGLPAMRIKGLMLAVTTLALALMSETWLLQQSWMLGEGVNPGSPVIGGLQLNSAKGYYIFALVTLVVCFWVAAHIRKGGMGRILVAIRDNEDGARAFTVTASFRKLQAFMLSGLLAGVGGAIFAFAITRIDYGSFATKTSINIVAIVVIGGVSLLAGPLIGALYIIGLPAFLPLNAAGYAAQAGGWLFLILYLPGGLGTLLEPLRNRVCDFLARRAGVPASDADDDAPAPQTAGSRLSSAPVAQRNPRAEGEGAPHDVLLSADGLRKAYGGIVAVNGVSLTVNRGETLGLIGPNGAGKTTLFELLSGFTKPDAGTIVFEGRQLTGTATVLGMQLRRSMSPERRGHLGLIRSFQDAGLFATLTVVDAVMLAMERTAPTTLFASVAGSQELERPKRARARELIAMMGLDPHRDKPVSALSTGTRRIVELCCMIALEPTLLLLDEPSSGIAQRETEALGGVLREVKAHLGATLVVIEHDVPLIMDLSDRIIAMDTGQVIAHGTPQQVRMNEQVIESYLGGNVAAIERSGVGAGVEG